MVQFFHCKQQKKIEHYGTKVQEMYELKIIN